MTYKSQTISAIVITENNAATLERTLSSLHWVDELIVFDRGSTDGSSTLARGFTDKVFFHPSHNLAIVRRDALSTAKCDWLLLIEPDEWVEEMLRHEVDGVLLNTPAHLNGFTLPRQLKFQQQWVNIPLGEEPKRLLRLVRRKQWIILDDWEASLKVNGEVSKLDRPLGYAPYLTVESLFSAINDLSTLSAYRYLEMHGTANGAQTPMNLIIKTKLAAWKQFFLMGGLFKGITGQTLAMANTLEVFLKYAKVRALTVKS
ncbi:glycosyltransferase [Vampirovibrio sp.]|uniref:glycosyltransferase n=1 Tax=Vampirovibrio sp. TaxID=2717857 RepID=UPI0035939AF9